MQKQQTLVARQFRRALVLSGLFVLFLLVLVAALGARGGFSIDANESDAGVVRHRTQNDGNTNDAEVARRGLASIGKQSSGQVPGSVRRLSEAPEWQAPLDAGTVLHVGGIPDDANSAAGNQQHLEHVDSAAEPVSHPVLSFTMSGGMSTAWRSSSKRLTFPTRMSIRIPGSSPSSAAQGETVYASATFYGKSSLKLKYTRRRSLHIHFQRPTRIASDSPALIDVLLLSLWEDRYRLAYRSSTELLSQLGLFHSYARLVELRCDALLSDADGDDQNVCRGGVTLGAYLLLEYPSSAIERFAATEARNPRQRVCEGNAEFAARRDWMMSTTPLHGESLHVEVATRNWFYFEKPKKYDMLHVPSYSRNSSLSKLYARIEQDPQRTSFSAVGNDGPHAFERFDLNLYLTWIAVNSILMNGDYDDEVFFFQVTSQRRSTISIMAWDYDTVFAPCHRKVPTALSRLMYCAETPIEKHIASQPALSLQYRQVLRCVLDRVATTDRWTEIVHKIALVELQHVLGASAAAARATFDDTPSHPPDVRRGAADLSDRFAERHRELESALPADGPTTVDGARDDHQGLHGHGTTTGDVVGGPAMKPDAHHPHQCDAAALRRGLASHLKKGLPREHKGGRGQVNVAALPKTVSTVTVFLPRESSPTDDTNGRAAAGNAGADTSVVSLAKHSRPTMALVRSGLYCAKIAFQGCQDDTATDYAFVLRDKERGAAEFAVEPFVKPPPTAMIHDASDAAFASVVPRGMTLRLRLVVPWQWVHDRWIPIIVLTTVEGQPLGGESDTAAFWLRQNQRMTIDDGHQPLQHSMLIRGYSALRVVTSVRQTEGDITEEVHGPAARWSGGAAAANGDAARAVTLRVGGGDGAGDAGERDDGAALQATARLPAPRSLVDVDVFQAMDSVRSVMGDDCVIMLDGVTTIRRGGTFTVGAGCLVVLREGATWAVEGELRLEGTATHPITVTSLGEDQQWVSIVVQGPQAKLVMRHAVVTGSGVKGKLEPGTGRHHKHSAAVTVVGGAQAQISHSYVLNVQGPAFAAGSRGRLDVRYTVVQWAELGVECVDCAFTSVASMWTNFPTWDRSYEDEDNDAMYLSGGNHRVDSSVIAHTKDDGIDSGTPEKGPSTEGGSLHVDNCIFESIQHEAIALSSAPHATRLARVENCWIRHTQQGIESGYSGRKHEAKVSGVVIQDTLVGLRYGDNYYNRPQQGRLVAENLTLFHNEVNALNYVRESGEAQQATHFRIDRDTSRFYPDRRQQRAQASGRAAEGMCAALYRAGAANVNMGTAGTGPSGEELARLLRTFALVRFPLREE